MKRERSIWTAYGLSPWLRPKERVGVAALLLLVIVGPVRPRPVHAQSVFQGAAVPGSSKFVSACEDPSAPPAVKEALHLVCAKDRVGVASVRTAVIICFLGGFVSSEDTKHPEVWFAKYLRDRYGPKVHIAIFGNREEKKALSETILLVDAGITGTRESSRQPAIIVYGHSWGGSQVLSFARDLEKRGIPVLLTIQIDSVRKPGQDDRTVPTNVANAVNFYQARGLTPGESDIVPADAAKTIILGNFLMKYDDRRINCDNYKWLSRLFNKPHHQIENDPRVWDRIASLIDSELTASQVNRSAMQTGVSQTRNH
jgi:hypothetical protein